MYVKTSLSVNKYNATYSNINACVGFWNCLIHWAHRTAPSHIGGQKCVGVYADIAYLCSLCRQQSFYWVVYKYIKTTDKY